VKRQAVVSCHVERLLDDGCWEQFRSLQASAPGGFRIAALLRPPDGRAGEDPDLWLERAGAAAGQGPLGHHTHFVGAAHARPAAPSPAHAARVREEAAWLRESGLDARFFCGGGWYLDESVADAVADSGYADCTATAFSPAYLDADSPRLAADEPAWLELTSGARLLELPATHSLGMAARAVAGSLPAYVHVYFHDTDLLDRRRRLALRALLTVLARRAEPTDLDALRASSENAPTCRFARVAEGGTAGGA
jgi:hypothetical protein